MDINVRLILENAGPPQGGVKNFTLNGEMGGGGGQKLYSKWGNGGGQRLYSKWGNGGGGQRLYSKWGNGGSTPQFSFIPKVTFFLGLA